MTTSLPDPGLQPAAAADVPATLILPHQKPSFAWVVLTAGPRRGRLFALKGSGTSLGRAAENDIPLEDEAVSRFHARITAESGLNRPQFVIEDLASANGTFLNGERIVRGELKDNDRLRLGDVHLVFKQF